MWKDLWQLEVPAKVKLLIQKGLNNILPTKDSLLRRNIVESNLCRVCAREKETTVHVLWVCPAPADIWGGETSLFRKWKRFYPDFQQLWGEMIGKLNQESIELAVVLFCHIWARRNAYNFQNQFKNPATIVAMAQADISLLKEINLNSCNRATRSQGREPSQFWQPPEWPFFKVSFDAAFDKDKNRMGMRIIMRDSEGGLQASLTAPKVHVLSAFQAEISALHRANEFYI